MNFDWLELLNRCVLLPISNVRNGSKANQYTKEIEQLFGGNAAQIAEFQLARMRTICRYAFENSEFYRKRILEAQILDFDSMSWDDFRRIPATTKQDIRDNLPEMLSKRYSENDLRRTATGGTTSSPTTFLMDWETYGKRWATSNVQDLWMQRARGIRQAFLWGASQDFNLSKSWVDRVLSYFSNSIFLPSTPLDDNILSNYYGILKRFRPRHLQAYSIPLAIFSDFLLRNHLSLQIPSIAVTAEPVTDSELDKMETALGSRPYRWYGARELGRIATECHCRNGMHLNVYSHYFEIDRTNEFFGNGVGDALITDLWNVGMPLLRYRIEDVVSLDMTPCACGMQTPRLQEVMGRVGDTFINSKNQKIPGVSFTNRIMKESQAAKEMQIIQTGIGEFTIRLVPGPEFSPAFVQSLKEGMSEFMQETVEITIEQVEQIEREPSGKVRFCKCLL